MGLYDTRPGGYYSGRSSTFGGCKNVRPSVGTLGVRE